MTGKRKDEKPDEKTVEKAVRLEDSELDAVSGGDSPLWQGEESYISDVEVTSQEGVKRNVAAASPRKLNIKSG